MEVCVRLVYCGVYLTPRCVELKVVKPDASNYRLQMFLRLKLFECSEKYYTRTSTFTFYLPNILNSSTLASSNTVMNLMVIFDQEMSCSVHIKQMKEHYLEFV